MGDATQAAHPSGSRDPADAAQLAAQDQQYGTNSGVDATSGLYAAKDNLKSQIPEEHQQRARETRDRTKGYLKDKLPEERRDQIVFRLKKMLVEIQGHQDCKLA